MYFIKRIDIDEKNSYIGSEIVNHAKTISSALSLLEYSVKTYIDYEYGKQESNNFKVIDIHQFSQINEPAIDTILVYRLDSDPHKLHLYQRKTKIVPGTLYGQSLVSTFRKIQIFELEEYKKLIPGDISKKSSDNEPVIPETFTEMVPIGPAKIRVPRPMTISPMCDLIKQLRESKRFKERFQLVNSSLPPESAPKLEFAPKVESISSASSDKVEIEINSKIEDKSTTIAKDANNNISEYPGYY